MKWLAGLAAYLLIALAPGPVWAWNSTGHMAVALLAWRQLERTEQAALGQWLRAHPHYQAYLVQKCPPGVSPDEWAFLRAATWPDWVRGDREHPDPDRTQYHHADWHYINLPFVVPSESGLFSPEQLRVPAPNAVTALSQSLQALARRAGSPAEQAIDLCWILHLVGDLHQPLHCAALVSRRYPPPHGDEGGNRLAVRPHKHPESLHAYWDRLLGTSTQYEALDKLVKRIDTAAQQDGNLRRLEQADVSIASWAQEGLQLAVHYAYLDGRLPLIDLRQVEHGSIPANEVPVLPAGYAADARETARRQAALASMRLALLLRNELLRR